MSGKFVVRRRSDDVRGSGDFLVVNVEDAGRPVAEFSDEDAARAHADKLNQGPLDLDEQEAWKDDWDDDWGEGD